MNYKKTKTIFLALLFLGIFGMAGSSEAAEYYVSPTGTAAWANCGSPAKNGAEACSGQTAMANAVAGDTVYFRGGNYYPPDVSDSSFPSWYPKNSGTSSMPITLIAYPNERVDIYQPSSGSSMIGAARNAYIVWDGFVLHKTVTQQANSLYRCYMANHVTIRNSEFIGNVATDSSNQAGIITNHCNNIYIYNNIFRDFTGVSNENTGAMWLFEDDHAYVYNNDFYDSSNGVQTKSQFSYIYAYNNFFRGVLNPFHWQQQWTGVTDFFVYNNVALVPSGGQFLKAFDPAFPYYNTQVYNNTIYFSSDGTAFLLGNSNTRNSSFWNNIVYGASGTTLFERLTSGAGIPDYANYNNYYTTGTANWRLDSSIYTSMPNWMSASGFDTNSIITNPGFVNPGGLTAADYKRASYPANGRGGSYASVMGAYITGVEVIGYVAPPADTTPPIILSVSSGRANGSYSAGEVIDVAVTFSEAVTSIGSVAVTLETGEIDRVCSFTVTNSATGTCNYIVQSGDNSLDLTVNSIAGSIVDQNGNAMINFNPTINLSANKALVIDTTSPVAPTGLDVQ